MTVEKVDAASDLKFSDLRKALWLDFGFRDLVKLKSDQWLARICILFEVPEAFAVIPIQAKMADIRERVGNSFVDFGIKKHLESHAKLTKTVFRYYEMKFKNELEQELTQLDLIKFSSVDSFQGDRLVNRRHLRIPKPAPGRN